MTKAKPSSITIYDVAKRAGVSVATVSRYINNSSTVAQKTAERLDIALEELNYVPHTVARNLATNKTHTIGLVLSKIGTDFYPLMIEEIEAEARKHKYNLLISVASNDAEADVSAPMTLGKHNADGLLVFPDSLSDKEIRYYYQNQIPLVLVQCSSPEDLEIPSVTFENKNSARKIVDHLIEVHGCQRIGFLAGLDEHEDAILREMGYRESLEAHNIPFDPQLKAQGNFEKREAQEKVREWIQRGLEFDAIFAGDDISAIGALSALNQAGIRVPEDVAVIGFDDIEVSQYLSPPRHDSYYTDRKDRSNCSTTTSSIDQDWGSCFTNRSGYQDHNPQILWMRL